VVICYSRTCQIHLTKNDKGRYFEIAALLITISMIAYIHIIMISKIQQPANNIAIPITASTVSAALLSKKSQAALKYFTIILSPMGLIPLSSSVNVR